MTWTICKSQSKAFKLISHKPTRMSHHRALPWKAGPRTKLLLHRRLKTKEAKTRLLAAGEAEAEAEAKATATARLLAETTAWANSRNLSRLPVEATVDRPRLL